MVVYLDLTEEIIASFYKCVKTGYYQPFFNENREFLAVLAENLKNVEFEKESRFDWISKQFPFCLKYLLKFDPRNRNEKIAGVALLEKYIPEFADAIKNGIIHRDWTDFYWKYRPDIDHMILEARRQRVIDFNISFGTGLFESFASREKAVINHDSLTTLGYNPYETMNGDLSQPSFQKSEVPENINPNVPHIPEQLLKEIDDLKEQFLNEHLKLKDELQSHLKEQRELTMSLIETRCNPKSEYSNLQNMLISLMETSQNQLKKDYDEKLEQLERKFEMKFEKQEEGMNQRREKNNDEKLIIVETLINKFEEKSKNLKETNELYLLQIETRIQTQLKAQEEQMKLRENELKRREEELERKTEEMIEMMKQVFGSTATMQSKNPNAKKSGPIQDNTIGSSSKNGSSDNTKYPESRVPHFDPTDDLLKSPTQATWVSQGDKDSNDNDDSIRKINQKIQKEQATTDSVSPDLTQQQHDAEIQKMEEKFQKTLAEQNRVYGEKLRRVQSQRREMNERAEEERRGISVGLVRAASMRWSFRT